MENKKYYEQQRLNSEASFYGDPFCDRFLEEAAYAEYEEQLEKERKAYEECEYLEMFTEIAEDADLLTEEGQEAYAEACLGESFAAGVRMLKADSTAAFSPSRAVAEARSECAVRDISFPDKDGGNILWMEKRIVEKSWNAIDGYTKTECVISTPIGPKKLKRMLALERIFPRIKRVRINDRKIPVYSLVSVLLCAAVLMIPIFLSIVRNELEVQNKEYDAYIRELREDISILEGEVALKRDMQLINTLAREEYGMIDAEFSQIERSEPNEDSFTVETPAAEDKTSVWVTLLSALGIVFED